MIDPEHPVRASVSSRAELPLVFSSSPLPSRWSPSPGDAGAHREMRPGRQFNPTRLLGSVAWIVAMFAVVVGALSVSESMFPHGGRTVAPSAWEDTTQPPASVPTSIATSTSIRTPLTTTPLAAPVTVK